ncbi:MAG: M23 family metallopeptidase [Acidimicrobiia bacterium]|nr:M23 family metallopeptidase [Acidimicrobiia bacterium]
MLAPSPTRRTITTLAVALFVIVSGATYTVQPGDTLSEIAAKNGTTIRALVEKNNLPNADRIYVGQKLNLPDASAAGASSATHIVQSGESLSTIAAKYGLTVVQLAAANGITNTNVVYIGTKLSLSGPISDFTPGSGSSGAHVVAKGDTLGKIAAAYGTTVSVLAELNGLANPNVIRIGQVLTVPGGGWICPVPGGTYFNDYGFPRTGGRFHEGTDLFATRGTPVLAPVSGRVEFTIGTIGGMQYKLYGDDGATYIGSHMDSFGTAGKVTAGTVIGSVGDSGNAKGSRTHLHFEIHPDDGAAVNPYPYLQDACR